MGVFSFSSSFLHNLSRRPCGSLYRFLWYRHNFLSLTKVNCIRTSFAWSWSRGINLYRERYTYGALLLSTWYYSLPKRLQTRLYAQKLLLFHKEMISAKFLGKMCYLGALREELQKDAINSNFEIFESGLYMKSVSMSLIFANQAIFVTPLTKGHCWTPVNLKNKRLRYAYFGPMV